VRKPFREPTGVEIRNAPRDWPSQLGRAPDRELIDAYLDGPPCSHPPSVRDPAMSEREDRVGAAVAWYFQAAESGGVPDPAAFLARFPDLRPELESFLADKGAFDQAAGPPALSWGLTTTRDVTSIAGSLCQMVCQLPSRQR
jgi:hypothetical protein